MLRNTIAFFRTPQFLSIGSLFAAGSLLLGIFVAALPGIKERLQFTDGSLGLSLLLAPAGSLTGVVLSPKVFSTIKAGRWLFIGPLLQSIAYIAQVAAPERWVFWLGLFVAGLFGFLNGVSSNAVVNLIEKRTGKRIMSTCHGMYSLGGGVSAGLAAVFYLLHIPAYWQITIVATLIFLIVLAGRRYLTQYDEFIHSGAGLALPPVSILGLSFICFVLFMAEGCVADWSAIYMKEMLKSPAAVAGLGYAGFSVMMAIGRFNGDIIIPKTGTKKIVTAGSLIAALGFLAVVLSPASWVAVIGFTIVGLGCCCIVPVVINAAADVPGVSAVTGISAVFSGGLIGFLIGPSVIGLLSEKFNLAAGIGFIILLCVIAAIAALQNRYLSNQKTAFKDVSYSEPTL